MAGENRPEQPAAARGRMPFGAKVKLVGLLVLAVLALILIFQNWVTVTTKVFFWEVAMPLAILLLIGLAVGFLGGILVSAHVRSRRNKS